MKEMKLTMGPVTYTMTADENIRRLTLPKSQTKIKDMRQLALLTEGTGPFMKGSAEEADDQLIFTYVIDEKSKEWQEAEKLPRHEKLRLLCNLDRFKEYLSARVTFFLHPDNLVFDENLLPFILGRGLRHTVPPYDMEEEKLLLQFKCIAVALFSRKYNFEELYGGTLKDAGETEFERNVIAAKDWEALVSLLQDSYLREKQKADRELAFISRKRFTLFKRAAYMLGAAAVIMAVPLIYFLFMKLPEQDRLLEAHSYFLTADYGGAISELEGMTPENLPKAAKYILAYSYIKTENLAEDKKANIMKNISMKTEDQYLLYWIYHGLGDFDKSVDLALLLDDPQLTMYGLIQQIEKAKNDPDLSGTEREQEVKKYEDQLKGYQEKYGPDSLQDQEAGGADGPLQEAGDAPDSEIPVNGGQTETESDEEESAGQGKEQDKTKK